MTITGIEALKESEVQEMESEKFTIKGFAVYLVDFGTHFGYSALVYKNNHQIRHANDYQLHHDGKTKEELKKLYLEEMERRLFTDEEIGEPLKSYDEFDRKRDFLVNLYGLQVDYVSFFHCWHTEEERQEYLKQTEGMYRNEIGCCWMYDKDFVEKHGKLYESLCNAKEHAMENFDYCKSAFLHEMYDHEYGINWQADWDVLNCFTKVAYKGEGTLEYLARTDFTDVQKKAYLAARSEYFEKTKEW